MITQAGHTEGPKHGLHRHVKSMLAHTAGIGLTALALLSTGPAVAQTEAAGAEQPRVIALEEVVVTAQFREEALQRTPLAITAISGPTLEARSQTNLAQISAQAPNVELDVAPAGFGKTMTAFIRGIGQGDFNFALEPGVGIYIDEVYHSTTFGSVFDLLDIERVEVLRGPQGVLFGKNSIGGAIRIISAKPKGDGTGYVSGTVGNFDRLDVRGGFDAALTNSLFMRVAASSKQREGYVDRVDFACANPGLAGNIGPQLTGGRDCRVGTLGGEDVQAARVSFRWVPDGTGLEGNFSFDYLDENSEAPADGLLFVNPTQLAGYNNTINVPAFGIPLDQRFIPQDPYTSYSTFRDDITGRAIPPVSTVQSYGAAATFDYAFNDNLRLKSISSYRAYNGEFSHDLDNSPLAHHNNYNVLDHRQATQEIQLLGSLFDQRLDWVVGAFYFDGYSLNRGYIDIGAVPLVPNAVYGLRFNLDDPSNIENKSAFVHAIYKVTNQLSVTAGVRYTEEDKDYTFNHDQLISGVTGATTYDRVDPKLAVDYRFTENLMAYVSATSGFRGGGINPRPFAPSQATPFQPEELISYEVGMKSEFFDRRLRLNLAAFLSDNDDLQLTVASIDPVTGLSFFPVTNVGEAEYRGVELELEAAPIDGLLVQTAAGFLDFEFKELGNAGACAPGQTVGCTPGGPTLNSDLIGVPDFKASLGVQYALRFPGGGTLTPRVDADYRSEVLGDFNNTPSLRQGGYTLVNARLTYEAPSRAWSAALEVTNLTDKLYYLNRFDVVNSGLGLTSGQVGPPLQYALSIRRSF